MTFFSTCFRRTPTPPLAGRQAMALLALFLLAIAFLAMLQLGLPQIATAADGETHSDRAQQEKASVGAPGEAPSEDATTDNTADEQTESLEYEVKIEGVEKDSVLELLKQTSVLESLQDKPPASDVMLLRRIQDDEKRFEAAMRSEGYYEAEVTHKVDRDQQPYVITFDIAPGRRFHLAAYNIHYVGADADDAPPPPENLESLGIKIGMAAKADDIVTAQTRLLQQLADEAHPLSEVIDRKAVVDHADGEMTVDLEIDPGPKTLFGPLTFEGLDRTKPEYLERVAAWQPGTPYDQRKIEELRRKIVDMGLFNSVRIEIPKQLDDQGELPITVSVIEGKARSIGFGTAYSSDIGAGVEAFWEHRNFFGEQDDLKITGVLSEIRQSLGFNFEKPNSPTVDKTLLVNGTLLAQQSDAYNEKSANGFLGVRQDLNEEWEMTYGLAPEYSKVDDNDGEEIWTGIGVPVILKQDATDSLLDPSEGHRLTFALTPTVGQLNSFTRFVVAEFKPSIYFTPFPTDRVIFAARGRIGSILGESRDEVPANHRFYAGGGGSIRGYEYQSVGPLDKDNDPTGGRSVLEMGAELRLRVTETIGVVPFVEGGTAYQERVPETDREIRWAAGLGLRYFTAIGPLRLDFAFPLNRRKGIDDSFQFYVSIGQSF